MQMDLSQSLPVNASPLSFSSEWQKKPIVMLMGAGALSVIAGFTSMLLPIASSLQILAGEFALNASTSRPGESVMQQITLLFQKAKRKKKLNDLPDGHSYKWRSLRLLKEYEEMQRWMSIPPYFSPFLFVCFGLFC